jgi:hydrogenase maturation protein HypF
MAAAALALAGRIDEIEPRFAAEPAASTVRRMLADAINAPPTSSMGRWFDAAAGLLGVAPRMAFEGQAAMLLEGLAERHGEVAADPALFTITPANELDFTPLAARLAGLSDAGYGAALFHAVVVAGLAAWAAGASHETGIATVAGGGGCFLNAILARGLSRALTRAGIVLLEAQRVPPNDGGLALGQAWVALQSAAGQS